MSAHRLDFAGLDLVNADGGHDDEPFWFETLADGFDLGSPQAVKVVAASLMRDGVDSRIDHYENRTVVFTVQICGPDLQALALGEAALSLIVTGTARQQLSWTPPDDYGLTTVFEVLNAEMRPQSDDLAEIRPGVKRRTYALTLECEPFGHSPEPVTQTFEPVSTSVVIVDAATSLTNWDDYIDSNPVTLSTETYLGEGVIKAAFTSLAGGAKQSTVRWFGTEPSTTYVSIDINWDGAATTDRTVVLKYGASGGVLPDTTLEPVAIEPVTHGTGAYLRYYFTRPLSTTSGYWFRINQNKAAAGTVSMRIANIASSNTTGSGGVQTVETIGSVRAPGSITATRVTDMAYLFLYSDPILATAGFSPAVQPTWASAPDGTYVVYAKAWGLVDEVLSLTFTDTASRTSTATTRITSREAGLAWQPIGEVSLGGFRSGLIGTQTIVAKVNGTPETAPELRLFRKHDDAALTYIDDIAANTIEMATPSVDLPRGGLWADDVACFDKALTGAVFPTIVTPLTAIYMESDGADPVHSVLSYYPRSHTYNSYVPL